MKLIEKVRHIQLHLLERIQGLGDISAWGLFFLGVLPLMFVDIPMVKTIIQWAAVSLAFAGITVIISRCAFPFLNLKKLMESSDKGQISSAIVVLGLFVFMAVTFLGIVLWAAL